MNKKILVVAAHPDDEVLGAGGTLARRSQEGWDISVIFCATGVSGRFLKPSQKDKKLILEQTRALELESQKALKILGIQKVYRLNFPDNQLDTVSRNDLSLSIKKIVQAEKPSVVFTHHYGDYNWDHTIVFEATLMACRPNVGDFYPAEVYSFEVLSSTERAFQSPQTVFAPNHFVCIRQTIASKKAALLAYKSEVRDYPHPRSVEAVENLAKKRGNEVGLYFAEAFQLIRRIDH